ncbi:MAG: amidohydrolase [Actinomycetales bacterium]|nr:amidohydrolase [Actinomycetales bacterium]
MGECLRAVDVHVHSVPRTLVDRIAAGEFRGVRMVSDGESPVVQFPGMAASPPMPPSMLNPSALAEAAASQHVSLQLLGPWTDLFGYTLPEEASAAWSRAYNEALAEECAGSPHQQPMATIPLSHPERAAAELEFAHEQGFRGAMVGTDLPGLHLGSPELEPVWAAAANLKMPILVHPTHLELPASLVGAGLKNAVGRAGPTAVALTRLVYSGVLLRHPELVVVACHGGGAFVAVAPRVLRNHQLGWSGSDVDAVASMRRLYFDSVVLDPGLLRYLVDSCGDERFLLGSDLPFPWEPDPVGTVRRSGLTLDQQSSILRANARRLYGLKEPAVCGTCAAG